MTEDRKEVLMLRARVRMMDSEVKRQRRRTDRMRLAVAAYLEGDIPRKRLERVYHDTDYAGGCIGE